MVVCTIYIVTVPTTTTLGRSTAKITRDKSQTAAAVTIITTYLYARALASRKRISGRYTAYIIHYKRAHVHIYYTCAFERISFYFTGRGTKTDLNIHTHFTRTRRTTPHNLQYIRTRVYIYIYTIHIICSLLTHMCLVHTLYTYNIS